MADCTQCGWPAGVGDCPRCLDKSYRTLRESDGVSVRHMLTEALELLTPTYSGDGVNINLARRKAMRLIERAIKLTTTENTCQNMNISSTKIPTHSTAGATDTSSSCGNPALST